MTNLSQRSKAAASVERRLWRWAPGAAAGVAEGDRVVVEEPLEIRLAAGGDRRTVAITMRTPGEGEDAELAAGFLYGEGIVRDRALVRGIEVSTEDGTGAVVEVELAARRLPDLHRLDRHVFTSSACGVCGRTALAAALLEGLPEAMEGARATDRSLRLAPEALGRLAAALAEGQETFRATGGLHAAALFELDGIEATGAVRPPVLREDVGRHNAVDKVVGRAFLDGRLGPPGTALRLDRHAVVVSGRVSFEIVQKCAAAGVPVVAAVSAPTSLAVEVAARLGITLVAFVRDGRFNVYSAPERIG